MIKILGKRIVLFLCITLLMVGIFIATPTQACACGMLISESRKTIAMEGEQGIVIFDNSTQTEQMVIDFQLTGTSNTSALVVPTPIKSIISQVKKEVFEDMASLISPPRMNSSDSFSVGSAPNSTGVEVLERKTVGSFEIAALKTNSYSDLVSWTDDNGFYLQPEAEEPVSAYIDNGFVLNVIKLKKNAAESEINPLLFTFSTSKYFYPLMEIMDERNDFKDKSLTLYLVTDQKVVLPEGVSSYYFADPINKEISRTTFEDEISKTNDADFSNLIFKSDNYFASYIRRADYSGDTNLTAVLGNSSTAKEFTPSFIDNSYDVVNRPVFSSWFYVGIAANIILISGSVVFVMITRRKMTQNIN